MTSSAALSEEKKYGRNNRELFKLIVAAIILGAGGIWVHLLSQRSSRPWPMDGIGVFLSLLAIGVLLRFFLLLLTGGPQLTLSSFGLSLKGSLQTKTAAWEDIGNFQVISQSTLVAPFLKNTGKNFMLPIALLKVDPRELQDELNHRIAKSRGIDLDKWRAENADKIEMMRNYFQERARIIKARNFFTNWCVGPVLAVELFIWTIVATFRAASAFMKSRPMFLLAFVIPYAIAFIIATYIGKKKYPIPPKPTLPKS